MMERQLAMMCAAGLVLAFGSAATAQVNMEYVIVGDPGNPPDIRYGTPGYGGVAYRYKIGKYEVTNAQYCEFLNAVAATSDPHGLYHPDMGGGYGGIAVTGSPGSYSYSPIQGAANRPVNHVGFWDACRFANWMHNGQGGGDTETGAYTLTPEAIVNNTVTREPDAQVWLPSEDEWYKAAYYKGGTDAGYWDYATQSDAIPCWELPPGTDLVNGSANYYLGGGQFVVGPPFYTTEVGAYTAKPSDSAYGTFDQNGNLWEWNETTDYASYRGVRGASWGTTPEYLHAAWRADTSTQGDYRIGFRVAAVPEPATLTLLALGGLALIRRRR